MNNFHSLNQHQVICLETGITYTLTSRNGFDYIVVTGAARYPVELQTDTAALWSKLQKLCRGIETTMPEGGIR